MEYRRLGRTGVEVSSFCLGAMMFGSWGNEDEAACIRMIHRAIDAGINFVDTADVYSKGQSEEIVGKALEGRRDDIVLATKVHFSMGEGPNRSGNSRLWILREVDNSLRRLRTDHIDLYQIHRADHATDIEETLGALTDLVAQGKVRYVGCSVFEPFQIVESLWASERRGLARFVCEQPPYSMLVRHVERGVFPLVQRHGMGAIVWAPLAGGWLTGKYRNGEEPPPDSRAGWAKAERPHLHPRYDLSLQHNQRKADIVRALEVIADEAGLRLVHLSIAFAGTHPAVTSTIIGPRTEEQLDDLLAAADVRLDSSTLDAIDAVVPPGTTVADADRGYEGAWMAPEARRR